MLTPNQVTALVDKDMQAVVDLTREAMGFNRPVKVFVKDTKRGFSDSKAGLVSVPQWAVNKGYHFAVAYAIHELCHQVTDWHCPYADPHGNEFKANERKALSFWNMAIEYKKAYPKKLFAGGELVYSAK